MFASYTAAVLEEVGKPFNFKVLPIPEATTGSATIRVLATALSPNSRQRFGGQFGPTPLHTPTIPSSASIARVHSVGSDATLLKRGQLVFTDFWIQSRDDPDTNITAGWFGGVEALDTTWGKGTFAEYANVPLERVWSLNESILCGIMNYSPSDLLHLGNINIALAGLLEVNVLPGDTVVVAPATGTYGGAAVHGAIALGANVVACGRNEVTLRRMAGTFQASGRLTVVTLTGDADKDTAAIRAAAGGKGADSFIDFTPPQAAGSTGHIAACINALRFSGRAALLGLVFGNIEIPYSTIMLKSIRVEGRLMFSRSHGERAIKLLESGHLVLGDRPNSGLKAHPFKLKDIEKAIDAAAEHRGWGHYVLLEP